MQLFSVEATIFKIWPLKKKKKLKRRFLISYRPELPNWPKKKNSCSKMWLIDQLYVKLGLQDSDSCPISKLGPAHEFNGFGKLKCYCEFECHQLESFDHKLELAIRFCYNSYWILELGLPHKRAKS